MTTSRKDHERIAWTVQYGLDAAPTGGTPRERKAWRNGFGEAVEAVADALEITGGFDTNGNRRFKRDQFMTGGRTPLTFTTQTPRQQQTERRTHNERAGH